MRPSMTALRIDECDGHRTIIQRTVKAKQTTTASILAQSPPPPRAYRPATRFLCPFLIIISLVEFGAARSCSCPLRNLIV